MEWPSAEVAALAGWIAGRTGLTFPPSRRASAASALQKALRTGGAHDLAALRARLESNPAELDELLAELTIGETYFFRHPEQFEVIAHELLRTIEPHPPRPLRLWSAGCATGEEAYSLAIVAGESGRPARVVGTDLSRSRLAVAQRGRYRTWSLRGVSEETIERYFRVSSGWYEIRPPVRANVEFRYLNLVEDHYPALSTGIWGMDVILCRNVLIYLDRDSVRRVAQKLADSLSEDGWLLLGASDPLLSDLAPVEVTVTSAGLAYRRRRGAPRPGARRTLPGVAPSRRDLPDPAAPPLPTQPPQPTYEPPAPPSPSAAPSATPPAPAPQDPELEEEVRRVRVLANDGQLAEAGRACAAALDRHRDSAELLYLHALLLLVGGQPRAAAEAARRALYVDRDMVVVQLLIADARQAEGDVAAALQALRRARRSLAALPPDREVPASDGESAGRLLRMVELRLQLLGKTIR